MKPFADLSDQRVVKALAHPLRVQILGLLEHQTASPSELSAELHVPLGNVSYHVRQLQSFGLIRLVRTTPRRGSIEHHYELVARPDITDEAWDGAARHRQARDGRRGAGAARPARQGRRDGRRVLPPRGAPQPHGAELDEEGWREVSEMLVGMFDASRASSARASSGSRDGRGRAVAVDGRAHAFESPPVREDSHAGALHHDGAVTHAETVG